MGGQTFLLKLFEDGDGLASGSDHADVAGGGLHGPAQHTHIVAMAAGDDDDVGRFVGRDLGHCFFEIFGDDLVGLGETFAVRVGFTVVDDGDIESGDAGDLIEAGGDVTGAEDVEIGGRQDGFDEDFERAPTDEAGVVFGILIEVEGEGAGLLGFHHFAGGLPDFGFDTAAADGSDDGSVIAHEHFRGLKGRDGSTNVDDGSDGAAVSGLAQANDLFVEVHIHFIMGWRVG